VEIKKVQAYQRQAEVATLRNIIRLSCEEFKKYYFSVGLSPVNYYAMSFDSFVILSVMQIILLASIIIYLGWLRDLRRTKAIAVKLLKSYLLDAACFKRDLVAFVTGNNLMQDDWFYDVSFEKQILSVSKSLEFYSNPLMLHDLLSKKNLGWIDRFIFGIKYAISTIENERCSLNIKRASPFFNNSLPGVW
jgi:hypothetical protein